MRIRKALGRRQRSNAFDKYESAPEPPNRKRRQEKRREEKRREEKRREEKRREEKKREKK